MLKKLKENYVTFERFIEGIVTSFLPIISYIIFPKSAISIKITFLIAVISYLSLFIYVKRKAYNSKNNET